MKPPLFSEIIDAIEIDKTPIDKSDKLFILGRNPELSLGELVSLYNLFDEEITIKEITPEGVIISAKKKTNLEEKVKHISIASCGSVLKRCSPIAEFSKDLNVNKIESQLKTYLETIFIDVKTQWTISVYNEEGDDDIDVYDTIYEITKQILKDIGVKKAYFVKGEEERILNPRKIQRRELLKDGFELILWLRHDSYLIAYTDEVIDVDEFVQRDINRPYQRPLLQIGLAVGKTMVNLCNIESKHQNFLIYDPFCGMGSILQEAYIMNYKVWGSDIESKCVYQTGQNLQWIAERQKMFPIPAENLFQMNILKPDLDKFQNFHGHIVTEPDLLTPLKEYPTVEKAMALLRIFQNKYFNYLKSFHEIMPDDGICVFIFPQFHTKAKKRMGLEIETLLKDQQFEICAMHLNNLEVPTIFLHAWKDTIIERQIVVFRKKAKK